MSDAERQHIVDHNQAAERMKALEPKAAAMQISGSGSHRGRDDSFQQLTVIGFDSQVSLEHRLVAMQAIMETHFPYGGRSVRCYSFGVLE